MKQLDISGIIQGFLTKNHLDIRDEPIIVKCFQFCNENGIEPTFYNLENTCKDYSLLQLMYRTIRIVENGENPNVYISEDLLKRILYDAK